MKPSPINALPNAEIDDPRDRAQLLKALAEKEKLLGQMAICA